MERKTFVIAIASTLIAIICMISLAMFAFPQYRV